MLIPGVESPELDSNQQVSIALSNPAVVGNDGMEDWQRDMQAYSEQEQGTTNLVNAKMVSKPKRKKKKKTNKILKHPVKN